jgi:hypothetical protein
VGEEWVKGLKLVLVSGPERNTVYLEEDRVTAFLKYESQDTLQRQESSLAQSWHERGSSSGWGTHPLTKVGDPDHIHVANIGWLFTGSGEFGTMIQVPSYGPCALSLPLRSTPLPQIISILAKGVAGLEGEF